MPVPVKATFEDGTEQRATTDRNRDVTVLVFHSSAKLRDVVMDPDGRFAMVKQPVSKVSATAEGRLAYGWDSRDAPGIYSLLKKEPISSAQIWLQLGLDLYGSDHLDEALDCFSRVDSLETPAVTKFSARAASGALEDLRGNRAATLAIAPGEGVTYSRLRLTLDRDWLQRRLQEPFTRESALSLPAEPTASELVDAANRLNYTHEGKSPQILFQKAKATVIKDAGFWFKLGLVLYDSGFYPESLAAFGRVSSQEPSGLRAFAALVWQGHLHDLSGNRERALERYREALKIYPGDSMQHSQYGMAIDREWIQSRLKTPFSRDLATRRTHAVSRA